MTELKKIRLDANSFEANGHKYLIHPSLSVTRFEALERLEIEAAYNADVATLHRSLQKLHGLLNKAEFVNAAVELHNLTNGTARILNSRPNTALLICTLFFAREDEDLREWNEAAALEKIEDWRREGYDMADFFALAAMLRREFLAAFLGGSLNSSAPEAPGEGGGA